MVITGPQISVLKNFKPERSGQFSKKFLRNGNFRNGFKQLKPRIEQKPWYCHQRNCPSAVLQTSSSEPAKNSCLSQMPRGPLCSHSALRLGEEGDIQACAWQRGDERLSRTSLGELAPSLEACSLFPGVRAADGWGLMSLAGPSQPRAHGGGIERIREDKSAANPVASSEKMW